MAAATEPLTVHLSAGGLADLSDVMHIMEAAFSPDYGEGWSRSQCAGILPLTGVHLVVARTNGGEPAGFALDRSVADEAELLLLAVEPRFRRRGVGTMLVEHFLASHRGGGIAQLHLEVRDGNEASRMYERFGFSPAGRRKGYYRGADGTRHDAVTMTRSIS